MIDTPLSLRGEASYLAEQLFGHNHQKETAFTNRLLDIYTRVKGKDFLLIHNPGGWGNTPLEYCLRWERTIVTGVSTTLERLGYTWLLSQHFRSGRGWRELTEDIKEQAGFFPFKREILATELKFLTRHVNNLKVIIIGVSQGAAFTNAVLSSDQLDWVYSIELGLPFVYKSRRVITERTLAVDGNGLMPDALMEWNLVSLLKTSSATPFRWLKYRLQGKKVKFSYCVNLPGHEYNWEYPEVQQQITSFLNFNFNTSGRKEGGES